MINISYDADQTNVIIVGSESGIGRALIAHLTIAKATVFGIDIKDEAEIEPHDNYHYFKADPLQLASLLESRVHFEKKKIHGLVCLSGTITRFASILDMDEEDWDHVYNISFKSCYNACKAFAPLLKEQAKASIVNMSSGLAFGGQANYGPYTTAKASINSLTKTLATELSPEIRVNSVAPGAVETSFIYDKDGNMRFDKERYLSIVPLKSLAKPEEIADLIMYLLSSASSHITGQCIHINGGAMMV